MAGKQDWATPWELFNKLDRRFNFTIDGAAEASNTKCDRFISPEQNAHKTELSTETIFCNPPYSDMLPWVRTFIRWSQNNEVVILCQDRTDTIWWRELVAAASEVVFLYGRVNFIGTETGNNRGAVVVGLGTRWERQVCLSWDWRDEEYPTSLPQECLPDY